MESSRPDGFRFLAIALIFSGALNIGLLMALIFSRGGESQLPAAASRLGSGIEAMPANRQLLSDFLKLSFSELIVYLTNREPVEEGYAKRDLALSALASAHHFHLEKALGLAPLQKRAVSLSPDMAVTLFPGLGDEQFEAIIRFAYQEKWPLTPKGLFLMLKKCPNDASLCEAFYATPEFHALQVLFQKSGTPQPPAALLCLAMQGPWDLLERFSREQAALLDLSADKRRSLLLAYCSYRSPKAVALLLEADYPFVKLRLEDAGILALIDLIGEKSELSERFLTDLLRSPRSDAVLRAAGEKLYAFAKETPPAPFDSQAALSRFSGPAPNPSVAAPLPASAPKPAPPARFREHTVQEGESLWKLSRQYKVKVDELIECNALEKDRLVPGMVLRIPSQGSGSEPPR